MSSVITFDNYGESAKIFTYVFNREHVYESGPIYKCCCLFFNASNAQRSLEKLCSCCCCCWRGIKFQKCSKSKKKLCKGTKNVLENKKFVSLALYGIELSCFPCMACGLVWPYVALYGLLFTSMAMCIV